MGETTYSEAELRRAYDEGVDMGERGFADNQAELDIGFRVLKRHIGIRREKQAASLPGGVGPDGRPHLGSATGANE